MLRIILGIVFVALFFFTHIFYLQILFIIGAVFFLPVPYLIILPIAFIYDTVFGGGKVPIFSLITLGFIIFFHILKPYLRS